MYKAIPEVFFETIRRHPNKTALLYKKEGVYFPITYKEFGQKVDALGFALQKIGVSKGDKVAILAENRPEWAISDMAIMSLGAVVVPLHSTLSAQAICNILKHSEAKVLFVSNANLLNKVMLCKNQIEGLEKIVVFERINSVQKESLPAKLLDFNTLISVHRSHKNDLPFLDPDETCSIIYTSGTTGNPKGVLLTHRNFLANVEAINEVIPVRESDVFLSFLPLSHVLERTTGYYMSLCYGATIAYAEDAKHLSQNLKEVHPTLLISVPRIFEKFYDGVWDKVNASGPLRKKIFMWALSQRTNSITGKIADYLVFKKIRAGVGGKLRLAVSGGASLDKNVGKFFMKIGIKILEGYGLTETSPVISVNREEDIKFGTVGKVLPGVKIKITDKKEILVKGANVTSGYFKNENEESVFTDDGWFCTGDMGFVDKQGFLTIIGRAKEMIVTSGGKNIWPEPIENILNNDRFIAQSIVVGNKQKFIAALLVPDWQEIETYIKEQGLPMQEHDKLVMQKEVLSVFQKRIDEKINTGFSDYEKVKRFVLLSDEFSQERGELTPTLKLRRHVIEQHYKKIIDSLYEKN